MKLIKKFCKKCGAAMDCEQFHRGFNEDNGKELVVVFYKCPNKRFWNFHSSGWLNYGDHLTPSLNFAAHWEVK